MYLTTITMNITALAGSRARAEARLEGGRRKLAGVVNKAWQAIDRLSEGMASLGELVERFIRARTPAIS
jgi:hypothetical protein